MSGLRVGACQTPEILGDVEAALACVESFAAHADGEGVDLLLFPECFLQGYLVEEPHLRAHALELDGAGFTEILKRLKGINGMWLVSSDVTGERGEDRVGYGPTCVIDPRGEVVARVPLMETGMAVARIA